MLGGRPATAAGTWLPGAAALRAAWTPAAAAAAEPGRPSAGYPPPVVALPPSCAAPSASAGYLPSASAGYPPSASWPRVAPPLKEEEGGYPAGTAATLACERGTLDTPPVRGGVAADAAELAGGTFRFRPAVVGGVDQ